MTEKERQIKQKLMEDLLKIIPLIIETEKEKGTPEFGIFRMVDSILDRVNQLRKELNK
jgi:hypothetical protein